MFSCDLPYRMEIENKGPRLIFPSKLIVIHILYLNERPIKTAAVCYPTANVHLDSYNDKVHLIHFSVPSFAMIKYYLDPLS